MAFAFQLTGHFGMLERGGMRFEFRRIFDSSKNLKSK